MAASARLRISLGGRRQRLQPELHVLEHREPREKREALEHHGDARGRPVDRLAEIVDRAAAGLATGPR